MKLSKINIMLLIVFLVTLDNSFGSYSPDPYKPGSESPITKVLSIQSSDEREESHAEKIETTVIPLPAISKSKVRFLISRIFQVLIYKQKERSVDSFCVLLRSEVLNRSSLSDILRL